MLEILKISPKMGIFCQKLTSTHHEMKFKFAPNPQYLLDFEQILSKNCPSGLKIEDLELEMPENIENKMHFMHKYRQIILEIEDYLSEN